MDVRMEHTEGLGGKAQVWVDGALLDVCDGISPADQRTPPGALEDVAFRYTTDETISWDDAVANNPSHKVTLEPVKGWAYAGFGRVEQVMPVVIHFGLLKMEDPNWSTDETLVGQFVRVPIDRLEIVPAEKE
jgi:hypothetical protein